MTIISLKDSEIRVIVDCFSTKKHSLAVDSIIRSILIKFLESNIREDTTRFIEQSIEVMGIDIS